MLTTFFRLMDPVSLFLQVLGTKPEPECQKFEKHSSLFGASVFHRGDPVWVFSNDYTDSQGMPVRFQLKNYQNSRQETSIYDVDALYFEKGLIVFVNGHFNQRVEGKGVFKIPDFYQVETIYRQGVLGVYYETDSFSYLSKTPHLIQKQEEMSNIWTMKRCVLPKSLLAP